MADQDRETQGVPMIAATAYLRPPPAVVSRIGQHFTLPRPVQLKSAMWAAAGFVGGVILALPVPGIGIIQKLVIGGTFGAFIALILANYQPLKGESLARFLGLLYQTRKRPLTKNGEKVRVAIGIAPIARVPEGAVWIVRSAVTIPPSQWDERGVKISAANRNLDRAVSPRFVPETLERPEDMAPSHAGALFSAFGQPASVPPAPGPALGARPDASGTPHSKSLGPRPDQP